MWAHRWLPIFRRNSLRPSSTQMAERATGVIAQNILISSVVKGFIFISVFIVHLKRLSVGHTI
jgi:hypothetical protein